jgi:hypothetical protein
MGVRKEPSGCDISGGEALETKEYIWIFYSNILIVNTSMTKIMID